MCTIFLYFGVWWAKDSSGNILASAATVKKLNEKLGVTKLWN